MTKLEHAIKHIKTRADAWAVKEVTEALQSISERLDKALSQEPCDDAVSREDAEQMFRNIRSHLKPQDYKSAEEFNTRDLMLLNAEQMIHALPSVTQKSGNPQPSEHFIDGVHAMGYREGYKDAQKQKSGKWLEHPEIETSVPQYLMFYECSECGDKQCFYKSDIHKKHFCNNCGAKMESEE